MSDPLEQMEIRVWGHPYGDDDDSPEQACWACGDPDCYGDCEAAQP